MKDLALRDRFNPRIQALAAALGHPPGVDDYLRALWVIIPDPDDVEFVRSPAHQLDLLDQLGYLGGDCDDSATLAASIMAAMEWPCTLVAIRTPGSVEFSHVFLRCPLLEYSPGDAFDIDPIVPMDCLPIQNIAETMQVQVWP